MGLIISRNLPEFCYEIIDEINCVNFEVDVEKNVNSEETISPDVLSMFQHI